mmetsp:Transcript_30356/g.44349  ORF Transcript_30356/g.44349 Transcript_30356/m.44349 type:complete len:162 (+) Transcript_30356:389-874(+)
MRACDSAVPVQTELRQLVSRNLLSCLQQRYGGVRPGADPPPSFRRSASSAPLAAKAGVIGVFGTGQPTPSPFSNRARMRRPIPSTALSAVGHAQSALSPFRVCWVASIARVSLLGDGEAVAVLTTFPDAGMTTISDTTDVFGSCVSVRAVPVHFQSQHGAS